MPIAKNLEKLLKQNKIKYQVLEHRKVFTAFDAAETQHIKESEVAKGVLLKGNLPAGRQEKHLYFAVLAANKNCDFKALSKLTGDKVSMAKEKDIYKLSAKGGSASGGKTKIGLITPFGSLYSASAKSYGGSAEALREGGKIPVFVDKQLIRAKKLNLPAGSYTESIEVATKDYLKLEQPILGNFSVKK